MELNELQNQALTLDRAEKRRIYTENHNTGVGNLPEYEHAKNFIGVWNVDKNRLSCIASNRYKIAQHKDVVQSTTEALQRLNIPCKAELKDSGDKIIVDIAFTNAVKYVSEGEEFLSGLRLINSYDKTTGIMILPRMVRLACSNGMVVNLPFLAGFNVRHTSKLTENLEKVATDVIKSLVENNEKFKALINDCIGDSVEWAILDNLAEKLFNVRKHREAIIEILKKDNHGDKFTRWDLYNAVTNYVSHNNSLSAGLDIAFQNKAKKIMVTPIMQLAGGKE
jgi:hypothetical protein